MIEQSSTIRLAASFFQNTPFCRSRLCIPISSAIAWGTNASQIGIMGFSAGGHLVATAAAHFNITAAAENSDTTAIRQDFAVTNKTNDDNWLVRLKNWMNPL